MLILAHRGAHHPETPGVAENSLDAFRAAADLGVDGVELDARRCADGVLVVHHDALLGDGRPVGRVPSTGLPGAVPTLAAALEACASLGLVNVEVKNSPFEPDFDPGQAIAALIGPAVARRPGGTTLVSSFNLVTMDACHLASPAMRTGWLTARGYDQLAAVTSVAAGGHRAINPPYVDVTPDLVAAAHALELVVFAWVVDEPARMEALAALGLDGIITDRPGLALAVLR